MTAMNEERAAIEAAYASVADGGWDSVKDMGIQMFKAGAAWQRTAAIPAEKPLPELMMASYHEAIGWNACRQAMLAAAPAQPAAHDQGDQQEDLHVWCATSLLGYTCHFGEASAARAWAGENGTIERVDLTPVPDLQVVKRQDQGEVQRLREALERATKLLSAAAGYATKMEPMPAKLLNAIDAELDASTEGGER